MKKGLALILALLLMFAVVACGSDSGPDDRDDKYPENSAEGVAKAAVDALEEFDMMQYVKLCHEDYIEAEEINFHYVYEMEKEMRDGMEEEGVISASFKLIGSAEPEDASLSAHDIIERYSMYYNLEVEDVRIFEVEGSLEYQDGSVETDIEYFCVIKIDGQWYLG